MTTWLAGMRMTADRLNDTDLSGNVVFLARRGTAQSITSGADSSSNAISWDNVDLDSLSGWSGSQPTRWTAPSTGWWILAGGVSFEGNSGGQIRECVWYVNGGAISAGRSRPIPTTAISASGMTVIARTVPRLLNAGDYVQLVAAQNSGSSLNVFTGSYQPFMSVRYGGPA
ncbi:hypothetical protein [Streptomyces sp. bgisy154]|uniref:hypothetical protein n=1 Tax=Streptomyces sp. bgisy154 TaxID=3413794 RepID=UPI003D74621A